MNLSKEKILKQTMLESIVNKDFSKFKEVLHETYNDTYKELVEENSEKIKRLYR